MKFNETRATVAPTTNWSKLPSVNARNSKPSLNSLINYLKELTAQKPERLK